jgi:hypothetical protein
MRPSGGSGSPRTQTTRARYTDSLPRQPCRAPGALVLVAAYTVGCAGRAARQAGRPAAWPGDGDRAGGRGQRPVDPGPPKTEAGRRTVTLPATAAAALAGHLAEFAEPGPEGLVFPAPEVGDLRRSNFRRRWWLNATRVVGVEGVRFHDLPHSATTLARRAKSRVPGRRAGRAADRGRLVVEMMGLEPTTPACKARSGRIAIWPDDERRRSRARWPCPWLSAGDQPGPL